MNVKEFWMKTDTEFSNPPSLEWAEKFAALVAAAERAACAKVCEDIDTEYEGEDVLATWCAAAIRNRGKQ